MTEERDRGGLLVGFDLLDRQILDRGGEGVGKVDDLELGVDDGAGAPYVAALLVGPQALGPRIGGRLGRIVTALAIRLDADRTGPLRIPYELVARVDSAVHLSVGKELLAEPELESWLREHVIARIPGSDRAG